MADRIEYTTIDKSTWGDGPWQAEPDKIQWVDEATDLDCLIVRNTLGLLCGYVGVQPEHPWHGRGYSEGDGGSNEWDAPDRPESVVDVHCGLTYSGFCQEDADEAKGICHVPAPGRPANVFWFGFDCGHCWDLSPAMQARTREYEVEKGLDPIQSPIDKTYRDVAYVKAECAKLARQLTEVE